MHKGRRPVPKVERVREFLPTAPDAEYFRQKVEQGWKLVSIDWEREVSADVAPAVESAAEEVPFGLEVDDDCKHLKENPREKNALMLMMEQIVRSAPVYDVVIIGSGAGGGTATKVLTDMGISVALLEAGSMINPAKDFKEHMWPWQVPHRGIGEGGAGYFGKSPYPFGYFASTNGGWHLDGEPYTIAEGSKWQWFRSRVVGGRTNHYGRISLRFADYDFTPYTRDGLGTDWPITYDELAPYYDKAEKFIGITGSKEGIRSAPDGIFQP